MTLPAMPAAAIKASSAAARGGQKNKLVRQRRDPPRIEQQIVPFLRRETADVHDIGLTRQGGRCFRRKAVDFIQIERVVQAHDIGIAQAQFPLQIVCDTVRNGNQVSPAIKAAIARQTTRGLGWIALPQSFDFRGKGVGNAVPHPRQAGEIDNFVGERQCDQGEVERACALLLAELSPQPGCGQTLAEEAFAHGAAGRGQRMHLNRRIGNMFDYVFQQEQVHIMASAPHQRSELEKGFFRAAAPEVGNDQGDFQI